MQLLPKDTAGKLVNFQRSKDFPRSKIIGIARELLPTLKDYQCDDFLIGMKSCQVWLQFNPIAEVIAQRVEAVAYRDNGVEKVYVCVPDFIEQMITNGHTNLDMTVVIVAFLSAFGKLVKPRSVFVRSSVTAKILKKYMQCRQPL